MTTATAFTTLMSLPRFTPTTRASFGYCLPLAEPEMPELSVIRARLFERAATLRHSATDTDLHPVVDPTILAA